MKKIINLIIQTIIYFFIILIVFFMAKQFGIKSDASIWPCAIGSTIGWGIIQGFFTFKKKGSSG